ncbi:MAG: helix-turn-helix transcriptional regulator [Clostridia bacterium]|nr:helix-turn-helix transcriptional regulator [Clostridia bacterium]
MATISKGVILGEHFCPDLRLYYYCFEPNIIPGDGVKRPDWRNPLLFLVTHGIGYYTNSYGSFTAHAGDCLAIFPGAMEWRADLREPWGYLCLELTGRDADAALRKLGFSPENPIYTPRNIPGAVSSYRELYRLLEKYRSRPLLLQEQMYHILAYLEQDRLAATGTDCIERAKAYIKANYRQPITVKGLAEMVSLSFSHFSRLFRAQTGRTVQQYLIQCRLSAAKQMLRESSLPVAEIAALAGFPSAGALSRDFHKAEGMTPTHYRSLNSL